MSRDAGNDRRGRDTPDDEINVGQTERIVSGAAAAVLGLVALRKRRLRRLLLPLAGGLASRALTGRCAVDPDEASRAAFLARHPDARRYAGFADFALYRFDIDAAHLVAGFGVIVDFTRVELLGGK